MTIPNFFKYSIIVDNQKIGVIHAPCRKVAQLSWESAGLSFIYPNAKIKFRGINLRKGG
jgi:hypothetical protein